jgi:hypothetical protein
MHLRTRCAALEANSASMSYDQVLSASASTDIPVPSACTGSVIGSRAEPVSSWVPTACVSGQATPISTRMGRASAYSSVGGPAVAGPSLSQTWSSIGTCGTGIATGDGLGRSVKHVGTTTRVVGASGGVGSVPKVAGSYRLPSRRIIGTSANVSAARPSTAASIPVSHTPVGSFVTTVPPTPASPRMPRRSHATVATGPIISCPVLACAPQHVRFNTVAGPVNAKMTFQITGVRRLR